MSKWKFTVLANVDADGVTTDEAVDVKAASDPDDACGQAIGDLRSTFGDDADISVRRIERVEAGNTPVAA
jgi:hypothetical protein